MSRSGEMEEAMSLLASIVNFDSAEEEEYYAQQDKAIEDFRRTFRFSFVHEGVTDCYSELSKARAAQVKLGINLPIWDAQEQITIPSL